MHYFVMKIPNKKELQQIPFNYLSDIDFQNFANFYKQCTAKFDTTLVLEDSSPLRNSLLERMQKLIMTIDDKAIAEKIKYDVNREAAKKSALSSDKTDKNKFFQEKEYCQMIK